MNPNELLRIVDSLHREKNIDSEVVFQAIEAALVTAARRQFGEEADILVQIDSADYRSMVFQNHGIESFRKLFSDLIAKRL